MRPRGISLFMLSLIAFFATPTFAEAQTLGSMMCSVAFNIEPFQSLMAGIAYIAGGIIIGSGLLHLVKHYDNQRDTPLHRPIAQIVAGAALLALPAFMRLSINTLFSFDSGGGNRTCIPIVGGGGIGLDGLMLNLVDNIKSPMIFMLSVMSIIIGIFLVFRGLVKASKYGTDPRTHSVTHILSSIIIGTILYTVGTSLDFIMGTVFGDQNIGGPGAIMATIAFNFGPNTGHFQEAVYAALTFFQLIGFIAFIRGWLILKDAAEGHGQKTVAQGLTHILGGVLAINIYRFLEVMDQTFGTGFIL